MAVNFNICKMGVILVPTSQNCCEYSTNDFFFLSLFLRLQQMWHMEVPGLGVESELQLPAYTTATATWDPSHICDLHLISQQLVAMPDP